MEDLQKKAFKAAQKLARSKKFQELSDEEQVKTLEELKENKAIAEKYLELKNSAHAKLEKLGLTKEEIASL